MKPSDKYDQISWYDFVYYDETSPSCLRWRINRVGGKGSVKVKAGDIVGHVHTNNKTGYKCWMMKLGRKMYAIHRIIMKMVNREWATSLDVDHINGDGLNNKVSNLRMVRRVINNRNKGMLSNNKSGITGVRQRESRGVLYWVAYISIGGVQKSKRFSTLKYGEFVAYSLAVEWRCNALTEAITENDFSDRHGK